MSIKLFKASKQSSISAILIDNNVPDEVADIIESEDFYATAHKNIYAGILELTAQGKPADLVTLEICCASNKLTDNYKLTVVLSLSTR
jgi:replicative DNA helicase